MVDLAKCPVTVLKRSWRGADQSFVTAYPEHKVYGHLEIDKTGRINFVMKLNFINNNHTLYFHIAKAHLYEMLMYHLTFKPIYPYYSKENPGHNHVWTYDNELKKIGIQQYDIDNMHYDEIKDYYRQSVQHMSEYVNECSETQMQKANKQMDRLLNRQIKIDLLYESERSFKKFKL